MKKSIIFLFILLLALTACSSSLPNKLEDFSTKDFEKLYNDGVKDETLNQSSVSFKNEDNGRTTITKFGETIYVTYTFEDTNKLARYNVTSDNEYQSIQVTDQLPTYSDYDNDEEYIEAYKNIEYKTEEADIPENAKYTYEDSTKLVDDKISGVFDAIGDVESIEYTEDTYQYNITFTNGVGTYYPDNYYFSFTDSENDEQVQFDFNEDLLSDELKSILSSPNSSDEENSDDEKASDESSEE